LITFLRMMLVDVCESVSTVLKRRK
jgi:hypothetical protein